MGEGVIAALITGAVTFVGMLISAAVTNNKFKVLSEYQIREIKEDINKLSDRVDKHNNLIERMAVAENSIKSAHHRLDELAKEVSKNG